MDAHHRAALYEERFVRLAAKLDADEVIPVHVPAPTIIFLRQIAAASGEPGNDELVTFLFDHFWSLEGELLRGLLPQQYHDLCTELETMQRLKEQAVVIQDWETARNLVVTTNELKRQMAQSVPWPVHLQPSHIIQAFAALGFDGTLPQAN